MCISNKIVMQESKLMIDGHCLSGFASGGYLVPWDGSSAAGSLGSFLCLWDLAGGGLGVAVANGINTYLGACIFYFTQ